MTVETTAIEGLLIITPDIFEDARGYFYESFNKSKYAVHGIADEFVQDNQSMSSKGVLRGLHFQHPPYAQGKLVRVLAGRVWDVVVDLRSASPTYGKNFCIELSAENKKQLWIPPGFAHGFATLDDNSIFSYKCTKTYHRDSEGCILWDDPDLNIDWNINNPILSDKDLKGHSFSDFSSPF